MGIPSRASLFQLRSPLFAHLWLSLLSLSIEPFTHALLFCRKTDKTQKQRYANRMMEEKRDEPQLRVLLRQVD